MNTKIIATGDIDPSRPFQIVDALDTEINVMWGLIAALHTISRENGDDPYIEGVIRLANNHLDALSAIRNEVDQLGK